MVNACSYSSIRPSCDVKNSYNSTFLIFSDFLSTVLIKDTTGTGDHFSVIVISDKFENVNLVNRHKMIYESLTQIVSMS